MTTTAPTKAYAPIDPATTVGLLALSVADLARSVAFYTGPIGLALLARDETSATLGVAGWPLLLLGERQGATPWPRGGRSYTGLYHFAILLPTRVALGAWLRHWLELGLPVPGQGDHLVSEALYLEDPDGHGIKLYRDRPRDEWHWRGGQIQMATDPVDLRGLLDEAARVGGAWAGLPAGTRLGHIHLQVGDIPQAATFYRDTLGFDIVAALPTALFVSAGGYHHHIGMNVWHSQGAAQAPEDSARLRFFTIDLPSEAARGGRRAADGGGCPLHDRGRGDRDERSLGQHAPLAVRRGTGRRRGGGAGGGGIARRQPSLRAGPNGPARARPDSEIRLAITPILRRNTLYSLR